MTTPRKQLEESARAVAKQIGASMRPGVGFALFVFDFGEKGNLAYISNAQRVFMVKAVEEWLLRQHAGVTTDPEAEA